MSSDVGLALREAMRSFPTGVTVLLAREGDEVHGMTANAVCSISLEPPLIMVSLDNRTKMRQQLATGARFSVNVLTAAQASLADQFARRWAWRSGDVPFADREGAPVLDGSLASLVCDVEAELPAGDHTMLLSRVVSVDSAEGSPLIFFGGKWTSFPGPDDVFLLDRTPFRSVMSEQLPADLGRTAVLAVDFTRGHLDADVATMPIPPRDAELLIERAGTVLDGARAADVPVIHVFLEFTPEDFTRNPFFRAVDELGVSLIPWRTTRLSEHNRKGSPQAQIVPALAPLEPEVVLRGKRRHSAFFDTDLEPVLTELGVETLVVMGMNTNTSILHTAFDAFCRDLRVVIVGDCTQSVYGPDLRDLALRNIEYSIGWVVDSDELLGRTQWNLAGAGSGGGDRKET